MMGIAILILQCLTGILLTTTGVIMAMGIAMAVANNNEKHNKKN